MPEIRVDAPSARRAASLAARKRPRALHFRVAPRAIPHERHQRSAAIRILAVMRVAAVSVRAVRLHLEARTVAPCAILPVELRAAATTRTSRRERRLELVERLVGAAPRTRDHGLGDRPRAVTAFVARVEDLAVLALELAEHHLLPERGILGAVAPLRAALLLDGPVPDPLELLVHDDGVLIAVLRTHGDGLAQPVDELRFQLRPHPLDPGRRPVVRPLDQVPGEELVDHEPEGEDVGLEHRPPDGLLWRNVADRPRSGRLQRVLRHLRITEIRQPELIIREQNEIIRLDVTVYDVAAVR